MANITRQKIPLVHELHPDGSETVKPAAVDDPRHEGIRGLGVWRVVTFLIALVMSLVAVYVHFSWPFALLAWVLFAAFMIGKRAQDAPPGSPPRSE
jgi:fatty acid desaturase